MKYAGPHAQAVAMLRQWADDQQRQPAAVHAQLLKLTDSVLQHYRLTHDVPGVRYWNIPETGDYFSTAPGERLPDYRFKPVQLTRTEFLCRQGVNPEYPDDLI